MFSCAHFLYSIFDILTVLLCMCVPVFQPFEGEYVVILNLVPAKYHYKVRLSSCLAVPTLNYVGPLAKP